MPPQTFAWEAKEVTFLTLLYVFAQLETFFLTVLPKLVLSLVIPAAKCRDSADASPQSSDAAREVFLASDSPSTEPSIVDPQAKVPAAVGHDDLQFACQKFDLGGPRAFCLEIFGGSCRLTRTMRSAGFNAWAVDYKQNKLQPESPAYLRLDLCLADHKRTFWRLLQHPRLLYVHFAPPCGTCSRAREVPIKNAKCPPVPLRSELHPRGLPGLQQQNLPQFMRVQLANELYDLMFDAVADLSQRGIAWSIENPRNSLLWYFPKSLELSRSLEISDAHFQHCMFDGARPKWTKWKLFPARMFDRLEVVCDGNHTHAGWGLLASSRFAAELEMIYPQKLCDLVVRCLAVFFGISYQTPIPVAAARGERPLKRVRDVRIAAAVQPRGNKCRRLLPEFHRTVRIACKVLPHAACLKPGFVWPSSVLEGMTIPKGARTIRVTFPGESGHDEDEAVGADLGSFGTASGAAGDGFLCGEGRSSGDGLSCGGAGTDVLQKVGADCCGEGGIVHGLDVCPDAFNYYLNNGKKLPKRGCLKHLVRFDDGDLYIGREHHSRGGGVLARSIWANPCRLRDCASPSECLERFAAHLTSTRSLMRQLPALAGKRLVCQAHSFCPIVILAFFSGRELFLRLR